MRYAKDASRRDERNDWSQREQIFTDLEYRQKDIYERQSLNKTYPQEKHE